MLGTGPLAAARALSARALATGCRTARTLGAVGLSALAAAAVLAPGLAPGALALSLTLALTVLALPALPAVLAGLAPTLRFHVPGDVGGRLGGLGQRGGGVRAHGEHDLAGGDAGRSQERSHLADLIRGGDGDHGADRTRTRGAARAVDVRLVLGRRIDETLAPLAEAMGLRTTVIFGGVTQGRQVAALDRGVDIVVACPGRLEDLMGQKHCRMDSIEVSVLDEADHMADLGFLPGVTRILAATPRGAQRLLFSATLDQGVDKLVKKFLDNPVVHEVDDGSATPGATAHHVFHVDPDDRVRALADLAEAHDRTVMFTRTKHGAKRLAKQLTGRGVSSVDLHGNLSQNCLLYTSPSPRDRTRSRMPSSA